MKKIALYRKYKNLDVKLLQQLFCIHYIHVYVLDVSLNTANS